MNKYQPIAVVGFACRYPDAASPGELWENILSRRRAFRNMPAQRLSADYFSADKNAIDTIYSKKAAVLKNYSFDRSRFNISNCNYNTADLTHWLSLEVASEAFQHAGLGNLSAGDRLKAGVIIGNTLTGEFSRSNALRLRWPYVAKIMASALSDSGMAGGRIEEILAAAETKFKMPFPGMEEDSLAGGLSNTIAGRICNYLDLNGGGYTIDGACSSSLLAICKACDAISNGDLTIALVGAVDLSLDPFELVGFSRAGALATGEMLVYDKHSNGFWPGEGCGFVVLADHAYAVEQQLNILGTINGWGISSDGKGGLTRPNAERQYLAIKRCYEKAGYNINTVKYIEGHGTGTLLGDDTELSAIAKAAGQYSDASIYLGSVKANIGHTKAAAGMAGLVKSLLVLQNRVIPPVTGCNDSHGIFENNTAIKLPMDPVLYDSAEPLRIGVSAMGFGGINTHITISEYGSHHTTEMKEKELKLLSSAQDTELFLFSAKSPSLLIKNLEMVLNVAKEVSYAELNDISARLYDQLNVQECRLAFEAASPDEFCKKLETAIATIKKEQDCSFDTEKNIYYAAVRKTGKIGFLFPGQGSGALQSEGLLFRRFPFIKELMPHWHAKDFALGQLVNTGIAQPAIVATSITAVKLMDKLGIAADVCVGHSVGELSALYCSGVIGEKEAMHIAVQRGGMMHRSPGVKGAMLSVAMGSDDPRVAQILAGFDVSLACVNSLKQMVFSGKRELLEQVQGQCMEWGIGSSFLHVENAFHSKLMKAVEPEFSRTLDTVIFNDPARRLYSTITGQCLTGQEKIKDNLVQQLFEPVLFYKAFQGAGKEADVWVETGSGHILKDLAGNITDSPVVSLDLKAGSVKGILQVAGMLFAAGHQVKLDWLFANRFSRDFSFTAKPGFISNACESFIADPKINTGHAAKTIAPRPVIKQQPVNIKQDSLQDIFCSELSAKLELPLERITVQSRMLDDFHLNSLFVGQLISDFAVKYDLQTTSAPTEYANASIGEIIAMFQIHNDKKSPAGKSPGKNNDLQQATIEGISAWVYPFEIIKKPVPLSLKNKTASIGSKSGWTIVGPLNNDLLEHLKEELAASGKEGLLVWLHAPGNDELLTTICEALGHLAKDRAFNNIVILQNKRVAGGFAKSIYQELKDCNMLVINTLQDNIDPVIIRKEIEQLKGFSEVYYEDNTRLVPYLVPLIEGPEPGQQACFNSSDLVLVTGGAKGITLECARALALKTGCTLILTGRTPAIDDEIINSLSGLHQQGIAVHYYSFDISDKAVCETKISEIVAFHGNISGIIHGAGVNQPKRITAIGKKELTGSLAPKLNGLQNIIATVEVSKLKYCFSFGSIIAEAGMGGNADYALANEWLRNEMDSLSNLYPAINFLNLEWSVWSGTGMGQNLGVLETLIKKGISPISLDDGVKFFLGLLTASYCRNNIIVTGRFGDHPLLNKLPVQTDANCRRFADDIKLFYQNTELIADFTLSDKNDLYLNDHIIEGQIVFPAVFGMEAMAQCVYMLNEKPVGLISFSKTQFIRPVIISKGGSRKLRIIAQRIAPYTYKVVLRDAVQGMGKSYFETVVKTNNLSNPVQKIKFDRGIPLQINVQEDLYGNILFHKGVFNCIKDYYRLTPYSCVAKVEAGEGRKYFSEYLPSGLILPGPALRDAAFHAVQACVPAYTILPAGIGLCTVFKKAGTPYCYIHAFETARKEDLFIYDIRVTDEFGEVLEEWKEVRFKILRQKKERKLSLLLVKNILQRSIDEIAGRRNCCQLFFNKEFDPEITKRRDGRPLSTNGLNISRSHSRDIDLTVISGSAVGCDIETVRIASEAKWEKLLGENKFCLAGSIAKKMKEDINQACTRVWGAIECLKKAGDSIFTPLFIGNAEDDSTIYLKSGDSIIVSFRCVLNENASDMVFSSLVKPGEHETV